MPATRECPLCGETMQLKELEVTNRIPGDPSPVAIRSREWVCPECDHFEEAEEEGA